MAWKSYKELIVWQKSVQLAKSIYLLVKKLPIEERYALSDQMRRAAVSIPSNIAEGHGRRTPSEFRHFLSVAKGSTSELETQLILCVELNFLQENDITESSDLCEEVRRILTKMIDNSDR